MYEFWRQPALPIGIVLLILGVGNWMVSRDKLSEFEHSTHGPAPAEHGQSLEEFPQLTPRTNAMLLARLHRRLDEDAHDARRDFYAVIQRGGRLIALAGVLLVGVGLLQVWRERRVRRAILPPSVRPPTSATSA